MAKRPRAYFWALHPEASPNHARLSYEAHEGLGYAEALAKDARFRFEERRRGRRHPPLSFAELGRQHRYSASTIKRRVDQARLELFGTLGDSGIHYRLKRARELHARKRRYCAAPDCGRPLPAEATSRRRYCDSACRIRAFRVGH
jgi:hypothetical protein